jgi:hypothetical protein
MNMKAATTMLRFSTCILGLTCSVAAQTRTVTVPAASHAPLVFYAASAGGETLDNGDNGGNPFASSLIDLLGRPTLSLPELSAELTTLTVQKSHGYQTPEVPASIASAWNLKPIAPGETRIALVIGISDYGAAHGVPSLPGVSNDLMGVEKAFTQSGFKTMVVLDADQPEFLATLAQFAKESAAADVAAIYATGHSVEVDKSVSLLLGDFPVAEGKRALPAHSVGLQTIASAAHARNINLIFYGGCRNNPF